MTVEYQKVWRTMNDLELVTSKIVSAREIIDTAAEAIQRNEYDKAETLAMAAYEFLGYYLEEFDEKFKLAWQETVVKQKKEEEDAWDAVNKEKEYYEPSMPPWGHSDLEYGLQYTDEEITAMCDAAEKKHSEHYYDYTRNDPDRKNPFTKTLSYDEAIAAGWEMTADGFWFKETKKKWVLPVEEVKDADTDKTEYFVSFPQDLLEAAKLKEGDEVEWVDNGDGSFKIVKVAKPLGPDEC